MGFGAIDSFFADLRLDLKLIWQDEADQESDDKTLKAVPSMSTFEAVQDSRV